MRFGKPDASLAANGWIGGLVASSAGGAFIVPAEAVVIGFVAGVLVTLSVEWIELRLSVDDPAGAISAHAVGGLWGHLRRRNLRAHSCGNVWKRRASVSWDWQWRRRPDGRSD